MFNGRIARIHEQDIELLRKIENADESVEIVTQDFHRMDEVEIVKGIFTGYRGHVVSEGSKYKIGISIKEIEYSLVIEVPISVIRLKSKSVLVS